MTPQQLRSRSMEFAVRAVLFCRQLPKTWEARRIAGQLIDSATSLAMNYRAAGRGRSHREFTSKLGTVVEEADAALGWLELIDRLALTGDPELAWLLGESHELVAIFGSSYATAKEKESRKRSSNRRSPDRRSPDSTSAAIP